MGISLKMKFRLSTLAQALSGHRIKWRNPLKMWLEETHQDEHGSSDRIPARALICKIPGQVGVCKNSYAFIKIFIFVLRIHIFYSM